MLRVNRLFCCFLIVALSHPGLFVLFHAKLSIDMEFYKTRKPGHGIMYKTDHKLSGGLGDGGRNFISVYLVCSKSYILSLVAVTFTSASLCNYLNSIVSFSISRICLNTELNP